MPGRPALGAADVTDAELTQIVATWCREDPGDVTVLEVAANVVAYDLDSITTAGRWWLSGRAATPHGVRDFRFFVKHVQEWSRSPQFEQVPPELRAWAAVSVPWRTEPLVYRSDLAERLPQGLTMARAVAVRDLDEKSAAIWLEVVPVLDHDWSIGDLTHAAYVLGRLAGSPRVRELAGIGEQEHRFSVRRYVEGRLSAQVLPLLRSEEIWHHPLVAAAFDADLCDRLQNAADRVPGYLVELEAVPTGAAHGDACTNNLLVTGPENPLVLIDFGFWSAQPLGFDLGQLLLGDVQLGRRPAADLPRLEDACVPAYVKGLRDEGRLLDAATVARAHALQMLIYTGLSSLPLEHLALDPTPERHHIARERAAAARFILDRVDLTHR